jgi:hypothetical protein
MTEEMRTELEACWQHIQEGYTNLQACAARLERAEIAVESIIDKNRHGEIIKDRLGFGK